MRVERYMAPSTHKTHYSRLFLQKIKQFSIQFSFLLFFFLLFSGSKLGRGDHAREEMVEGGDTAI